jgi:predicted transcriptional regulator
MKRPPLPNAELAVMNLLWENEEKGDKREKGRQLTARQIQEQLYPDATKSQHGTVQKLLKRLEDKGYVKRDRSSSVQQFSATISRQTYAGRQLESLATKLTAGSFAPLITYLVEKKKISRDEISRIRAILDEHKGEEEQA